MFDYLVVGSGLFGAVFAREMTDRGFKCLIIEKRDHLGGNVYCENVDGINVHKYGPHIFHTNDKDLWEYVNRFVSFNRFTFSPLSYSRGRYYSLPFNMNTFYQIWGVHHPDEARRIIERQACEIIGNPRNLEQQAIKLVGRDIYELLIKGYTEKQWGRNCTELPPFIIKRLPVRYTFDNNYFNDSYQGIPIGGYNVLIEGLLHGIEVRKGVDYLLNKITLDKLANAVVYTGEIDRYYNYCFGPLEYRSLDFQNEIHEKENYQGVACINYAEVEVPYTRIVEHKHFENSKSKITVITKEYPKMWDKSSEPYYPINDEVNNRKYAQYKKLADSEKNIFFGGRLAEYRYYDMHQIIASARTMANKLYGSNE